MIARIQAWLAALGVALLGIGAAWLRGRSAGRTEAQARQDQEYRETRGRIDAVQDAEHASDDDVARRLREHAKRPRDL